MNDFISFPISIFGLVVITWLITRRQQSFPLAISLDNPRKEVLIALIPTAVLFGLTVLLFAVLLRNEGTITETYTLKHALGQLSLNLISMIPFAITMVIRNQGPQTAGITQHNLMPALLIGIATSLIFIISYNKVSADFWLSSETFFRLVAYLGVGFSEEAIFRGYLQLRFSAWLPRHGWIAVAVIFALWHIPGILFKEEVTDMGGSASGLWHI